MVPWKRHGLSGLGGLLTGILAGPERIRPSEQLPRTCDAEEPVFATQQQAQAVLSAILDYANQIAHALNAGPDRLVPIYGTGLDGRVIAADWAAGFMDA